ncbi:hypothetical protein BX600DRAFT_515435 [Xylariales sp. PMI_506]|nr:hypothetical protein BX600DRAFT_515435 [Xylariales sp. PMI_506]
MLTNEHQSKAENPIKSDSRSDREALHDHADFSELDSITIFPEVRKCGIVDFKNRFDAGSTGIYAVDVLEVDRFSEQEVQEELKLRQSVSKSSSKSKLKVPRLAYSRSRSNIRQDTASSDKLISRIRIQSPSLLLMFSKIFKENWDNRPRTYIRPFSPLISIHSEVCELLQELESKSSQLVDAFSASSRTPVSIDGFSDQETDSHQLQILDESSAALADLRSYVGLMEDEIMPLYHRFQELDEHSGAKISFADLWYLYRLGETVYRPRGSGADREVDNLSLGHRMWRCYGLRPAWPRYRWTSEDQRNYISYDDNEMSSFAVHCYYIDYTGDEFCVVTDTFEIQPYEGERPISSLKIYPKRFLANHNIRVPEWTEFGKMFLRSLKTRHATYNWWTVTIGPKGEPTTDAEGNELKRPEYVDSEVIVDFVEASQTCPSWKPVPSILKAEEPSPYTAFEDFSICWWSDASRTSLLAETTEAIVVRSEISTRDQNRCLLNDIFLASIRENVKSGIPTTGEYLRECDYVFLPIRVFAYVLRDRKFVQLEVQKLRPVTASSDAFDYLKIHDDHKDMIRSLGKGKGLFILLHGVPGVGKTATAEAVAQASGKPLFAITCGDLGLTPNEVETALQRIFRLANTWDCVLLLDEVDTFFSQRSKGDSTLTKNTLVSVFLRVLEYYDGLLFLTTNRPGALDEAFRSRLHLTLYYPPLSFQQTLDIWRLNIDRLRRVEMERHDNLGHRPLQINDKELERFARDRFQHERGRFRWNGRQIRNAFQIASSLAHFEARRDDKEPRLSADHFKMIHMVTEDFDRYMSETKGKGDGDLAFDRGDRADHWDVEDERATTPGGVGSGTYHDSSAFGSGRSLHSSGGGPTLMMSWPAQTRRRPVSPFGRGGQ